MPVLPVALAGPGFKCVARHGDESHASLAVRPISVTVAALSVPRRRGIAGRGASWMKSSRPCLIRPGIRDARPPKIHAVTVHAWRSHGAHKHMHFEFTGKLLDLARAPPTADQSVKSFKLIPPAAAGQAVGSAGLGPWAASPEDRRFRVLIPGTTEVTVAE